MAVDPDEKDGGPCLNLSANHKVDRITDVIGGHGPWQFRCWAVYFLASVCCSLHLFAIFPLSSKTPCSCRHSFETDNTSYVPQNASSTICNNSSTCIIYKKSYFSNELETTCGATMGGNLLFLNNENFCTHVPLVVCAKCIFVLACIISAIATNLLTSRFGRKPVSLTCGMILLASALATSWSGDKVSYLTLRFFSSCGIITIYFISSSSLEEFISCEYSQVYRLVGHIGWSVARFLLPLAVWLSTEWMCFNILLTSITLFMVVSLIFIPESVASYAHKESWGRVHKIVRTAANSNGYPTDNIERLAKNFYLPKDEGNTTERFTLGLSRENLLIYLEVIVHFLIGFTSSFHYFYLLWLTDWYNKKRGGYFALLATSEVAAIIMLLFFSYFISRRRLWAGSTVLGALALVGMYFKAKRETTSFSTLMYLTTTYFISSSWTSLLMWVVPQISSQQSERRSAVISGIGVSIGYLTATLLDLQKFQAWNPLVLLVSAVPHFLIGAFTFVVPDTLCKLF